MSRAEWPATVPSEPLDSSFAFAVQDEISRIAMDRGPPRVRNRFTSTKRQLKFELILAADEFAIFKGFYSSTLEQGTRDFVIPVWDGNQFINMRAQFTEPYQASDFGIDMVRVGLSLWVFEFEPVAWDASVRFAGRGSMSIAGRVPQQRIAVNF